MDYKAMAQVALRKTRIRMSMHYTADEMVQLIHDILTTRPADDPTRRRIEELLDLARERYRRVRAIEQALQAEHDDTA